ncbi:MAG: hypothetical protein WCK39_11655 [Methanomassiliicoccales archaeon]
MRTNRDIVSSLDMARKRKAVCRTIFIENGIRQQQIAEGGELLSPAEKEAVVDKERRRMQAQVLAKKKSQRKILRQKEKSTLIQQTRNEAIQNSFQAKKVSDTKTKPAPGDAAKGRAYHEIVFKY